MAAERAAGGLACIVHQKLDTCSYFQVYGAAEFEIDENVRPPK